MHNQKYSFQCRACATRVGTFREWFDAGQMCPNCSSPDASVEYRDSSFVARIPEIGRTGTLWSYFPMLPVADRENIISCGEGFVPIEHWPFLDRFAREHYGIHCEVHAHRHDNSYATGTFKDLAGSVVASVLKENGVNEYCVSSTGNIGVAYSRYLSQAEITLYVFIPKDSAVFHAAEIACFGQKVFQVQGDYTRAKALANEFSRTRNILPTAGTFDPMRVEAKKTMAYEWARQMHTPPTVYVQALSGGTGPLGVYRGAGDLVSHGLLKEIPRLMLIQSDSCSPMAEAWARAARTDFPQGWIHDYPVHANPATEIVTLSTGDPTAYPALAPLVRDTGGAILAVPESRAVDWARLVAFETAVRIGPAAAIAVGGFFEALKTGRIRNGDVVLVNIGEGMRRAPDFMAKMLHSLSPVRTVEQCGRFDRARYRDELWQAVGA